MKNGKPREVFVCKAFRCDRFDKKDYKRGQIIELPTAIADFYEANGMVCDVPEDDPTEAMEAIADARGTITAQNLHPELDDSDDE